MMFVRLLLAAVAVFLLVTLVTDRAAAAQPDAKRPHILFILTDQQRAECLGCAGHYMVKTPNIDRLAADGIRFSHCFTTSPLCVPARVSILTGFYPQNSHVWQAGIDLSGGTDTYAQRLRQRGYRTALIGKTHFHEIKNVDYYAYEPLMHQLGFDDVYETGGTWSHMHGDNVYIRHLKALGLHKKLARYLAALEAKPDKVRRFIAEPLPIPADDYVDAFIGDLAVEYVNKYDRPEPSFLYVGFQGPHEPWDAPKKYFEMYDPDLVHDPIPELPAGDWLPERSRIYQHWAQYFQPSNPHALKEIAASYFGKITMIDDAVGKIIDAYRRKGWWDNTAVIYSSDHGEMLGDLGRVSKSICYDPAIRVPLIVRLPDHSGAGKVVDCFVETVDIYRTLLDLAGAKPAPRRDSLSLVPLVKGQATSIRDDVLVEVHAHTMLRTKDWKLVIGRDGKSLQLFDLVADPHEQKNLVGHPDYQQQELALRSRLLSRIAKSFFREGKWDPEFSASCGAEGRGIAWWLTPVCNAV